LGCTASSIKAYGAAAAQVLARGGGGSQLHPCGRSAARRPAGGQRPDPAARAGAGRAVAGPDGTHGPAHRGRCRSAAPRAGRARCGGGGARLCRGRGRAGTRAGPDGNRGLAAVDLAELLAGFRARYPAVEISLTEAAAEQLVEELQLGRLDVVLV